MHRDEKNEHTTPSEATVSLPKVNAAFRDVCIRRLSQRDIRAIESLIGARIAKPVPTYAPTVHRSANPIRGPHQPLRQALRAH